MDAKVSPNASFTWQSICSAREIIDKGDVKVVGKGNTINIWRDPWIPTLPKFWVSQQQSAENEEIRVVSDLMNENRWNIELINSTFSPWEAKAITIIPLARYAEEDGWTWHFTKHGDFTVRSAYYKEMESKQNNHASSSNQLRACVWKRLWQARVPPKIKNFGWKVLHNAIPVNKNLCTRGIEVDKWCSVCGSEEEDMSHALMRCLEAKMMWYTSPLRLEIRCDSQMDFKEWCIHLVSQYNEQAWWDIFWSLLWGLWLKRNAWVFEQKRKPVNEVVARAASIVGEYEVANTTHNRAQNQIGVKQKWEPPPSLYYKVNSDAACFEDGSYGLGGIMRDEVGDVLVATCMVVGGNNDVEIAEALAARHALTTALEAGLNRVILEVDNLKVFTHLQSGKKEKSHFGVIVNDIRKIADQCIDIKFSHVGRKGNVVAHKLAKMSCKFEEMRVWIEEVPHEILRVVTDDYG